MATFQVNFNPIIGLILTKGDTDIADVIVHFNPIIGLILTRILLYLIHRILIFQSHYRSDFNQLRKLRFQLLVDFNPIIGLILTLVGVQVIVSEETFQSHYRSDFNHIYINMYTCCYLISIPL